MELVPADRLQEPFVSMDSGATWVAAPVTMGLLEGTVAPISATSVAFNASAGPFGTFYMAMRLSRLLFLPGQVRIGHDWLRSPRHLGRDQQFDNLPHLWQHRLPVLPR